MASRLAHADHRQDLDNVLSRVLLAQLIDLGFPRTPAKAAEIKHALKLSDAYERWLEESLHVLTDRGHLEWADGKYSARGIPPDTQTLWQEWDGRKQEWQRMPALAAQTALVDKTLQALPDILTGSVRATDIMFPNASMSLVEGIYKNNPVADYFNDTIAELAAGFIEQRLRQDATARIRILEIGAGTGGTSARVLPRLDEHREQIEEYCYSDLSRAFLAHGEDLYGAGRGYLSYQMFDVEKPIAVQGVEAGSYDLVIATNVLHATKNIRRTLRNVKATLRRNGLLMLNELCEKGLPDHLTFGLLEGWWLYEDPALRLPGSPALLPETWQRILEAEGFGSVFFPTQTARSLGLQVVVAESNGVVRQAQPQFNERQTGAKLPQASNRTSATRKRPSAQPSDANGDLTTRVQQSLVEEVARLLKLKPEDVAPDNDLSEYGFDSISFNQLVNKLNQTYQLELAPTVFFEHPTLEAFGRYLLAEHRQRLAEILSPSTPAGDAAIAPKVDTPSGSEFSSRPSPVTIRVVRRPLKTRKPRQAHLEETARKEGIPTNDARPQTNPGEPPSSLSTETIALPPVGGETWDAPLPTSEAGAETSRLSNGQEQLWFLEQLEDLGAAYHVPVVLQLSGSLNVAALEQSLNTIVERHKILSACFSASDGDPVQITMPTSKFRLAVEDFESLPEADRSAAAKIRQQEIIQKPFNLSTGPLFRAALLRLSASEHRLIVVMHHIVTDGWSIGVLLKELEVLYTAYSEDREHSLAALPLQYTDFAPWQRGRVESEAVRAQVEYWREQLRDMPAGLALPTDRPRPAKQSFRGGALPIHLPEELTGSLRELSRSEGVTLYMVLLGAFQLLLSRLSGQTDIAIGTPSAGRSRHELETLIGFFSNTLVLRTDTSGNPTFRELLKRVKETALGAYAHQDLPFGQVVEAVNPTRDMSRPVLFQVMLQLLRDQMSTDPVQLGDLTTQLLAAETGGSQFDMTVTLIEEPSRITGAVEYAVDLFDKATIERISNQFVALLEEIVAAPGKRVAELSLLTRPERNRLLLEWNNTACEYPRDACVHQLFEAQAAKTPEAVALIRGKRQLTYAELDRSANQVAHYLRELGVGPEAVVGLCVGQSPDLVIGLLGILKAGGAYLPLDPRYPRERLAYMLEDARVAALVTEQEFLLQLPVYDTRIIRLDADHSELARQPETRPANEAEASNIAYVIYTSGSTGKPKGVAMPHAALANLVSWHLRTATAPDSTRILQLTPTSFDVSFQEIFTTLASGRCLLLAPSELRLDRVALLDFISQNDVHEVFAPQVLLEQIAEEADARGVSNLPLKRFYQAGEALRVSPAIARLFEQRSEARLHNQYGPTEAHVVSSFELPAHSGEIPGAVPIGRPIANTQLYVLDDRLEPVPIGVAGELFIGGECLARGYLGRPALTAERFIPNPFAHGKRLYRTGDRARYLPDGNLEFLGRADDQVKIRGFRVELGEIEEALRSYPGVRQAAVVAKGADPSNKRLIAFIVPDDQSVDAAAVKMALRNTLPDYMVPAVIVSLDAFPLTPSGKIDRRSLPEPPAEIETRQILAPRDAVPFEKELAQIWAEALQLSEVGIDDNFFELGSHSLLLMRIHSKLISLLGRSLPVTALFQYPTIRKLANHLANSVDDAGVVHAAQARGALRRKFIQSR